VNRDRLRAALVRDEGIRLKPYHDSLGVLTIGVGRNLEDVGISTREAYYLLDNDLAAAEKDCRNAFPWFAELDAVRQDVLINMAFNLGIVGLKGFTRTLAAVKRGDYAAAAKQMLASKWAKQVKRRASRLATEMETGIVA
jgi:lysozyme